MFSLRALQKLFLTLTCVDLSKGFFLPFYCNTSLYSFHRCLFFLRLPFIVSVFLWFARHSLRPCLNSFSLGPSAGMWPLSTTFSPSLLSLLPPCHHPHVFLHFHSPRCSVLRCSHYQSGSSKRVNWIIAPLAFISWFSHLLFYSLRGHLAPSLHYLSENIYISVCLPFTTSVYSQSAE